MKKNFITICILLCAPYLMAQTGIIGTGAVIFIDPTNGVSVTDTGSNANVSKTYSLVGSDSAIQNTVANQPRLVNQGLVKAFEHTAANKDQLLLDTSAKYIFRGSFSVTVIVHPFSGLGAVSSYVGVFNGDNMSFQNMGTDGKLQFSIQTGVKKITAKTANSVYASGEDFTSRMFTVIYDSTVHGIGGLKLYDGTIELALDAVSNGNTSGYPTAPFNPASPIGIGCRNRVMPDQAFGGRIGGVVIYDRVITDCELRKIEDYYTDTLTPSLFGLLNNAIECWVGIGQSNMVGFAPQAQFPSNYTGIQWGGYTNIGSINQIQPIKYTSGNWGHKFLTFKKLADYRSKPILFIQAAVSNTGFYYSSTLANWNVENTADSGSVQILTKRNIDSTLVIIGRIETNVWNLYKHHIKIQGFICLGGETDAASTLVNAQAVDSNFFYMRQHFRDKLGNDSLPFVIANIRYPIKVNTPVVQQALLDCSNQTTTVYSDSLTDIFSTQDLTQNADSVHFNGPGQIEISERFFNLMKNH